ncbi:Arm DNA-binding domain-containing protein [Ferrimonas aestuarii]|uniref:DUF4102 domain-containing protein n=1 Tax=Ferrimonas aestuarii TaxID=2569539 RepID=A0A4U1BR26_9GAMM|nr:Arm DNA-binding domain-containing protein [Ferrimonas aestuarii]TKB57551.1 DUF4102 domain-containing protein [Ferrimonas aestuarii]
MSSKLSPKKQVLALLEQCLETGVRGRVQGIIKQAIADIDGRSDDVGGYDQAESDINEPDYPGLIFKVGRHKKRWLYRYTPSGARSTKQQTLGHYPQMSRNEAIQAWERCRVELGQAQPSFTLGDAIADFMDEYARHHRANPRRDQELLLRHLEPFAQLAPEQFGRQQALLVMEGITRGAGERLALFKQFFDYGRGIPDLGQALWLPENLANPFEGVELSRSKPLPLPTMKQLAHYDTFLRQHRCGESLLLQLQLTNLGSSSFWRQLKWEQVDWPQQRVQFEQGWLPLSTVNAQRLKQWQTTSLDSVWVFPSPSDPNRVMSASSPRNFIRKTCSNDKDLMSLTSPRVEQALFEWLCQQEEYPLELPQKSSVGQLSQTQIETLKQALNIWSKMLHMI